MGRTSVICNREYTQYWILFNNIIEEDSQRDIETIKTFPKIFKKIHLYYIKIYGSLQRLCNKINQIEIRLDK
jgi:hypothetical protein